MLLSRSLKPASPNSILVRQYRFGDDAELLSAALFPVPRCSHVRLSYRNDNCLGTNTSSVTLGGLELSPHPPEAGRCVPGSRPSVGCRSLLAVLDRGQYRFVLCMDVNS